MRILSIDWDYFVEEDPMHDWSHQESGLFLTTMWGVRQLSYRMDEDGRIVTNEQGKPVPVLRDLKELCPFRGNLGLITKLPCLKDDYRIAMGESHQVILQLLEGQTDLEIVNIDAHHDLGYKGKPFDFTNREPDCGSWGEYLISQGRVASWKQIYPKWRIKFPEGHESVLRRTKKKLGSENFTVTTKNPVEACSWRKVDYVFVCRSGCWTPPIYDDLFNIFLKLLGSGGELPVRELPEITTNSPQEETAA